MKDLATRLARLKDWLVPTDVARGPRQRLRVVVCRLGHYADLGDVHMLRKTEVPLLFGSNRVMNRDARRWAQEGINRTWNNKSPQNKKTT